MRHVFVEDRLELGLLSREVLERLPWTSLEPNLRRHPPLFSSEL